MAYGSIGAEQVGFLEAPRLPGVRARLEMMGGEFCGNASMSLAALLAHEDGLADGAAAEIPLEVSGAEDVINCRIVRRGDSFLGTVKMPLPKRIGAVGTHPAVFFDGIVHAILPENAMTPAEAEAFAREQCALLGANAMGVLLVNTAMSAFRPLVYVRETNSCVWEHGCGSGSAAIGAYAAVQRGSDVSLDLAQPGGVIRVHAACSAGCIQKIEITGTVRIAATGTAWVEL